MQSHGKVSSCVGSDSAVGWRSVDTVRVDVHERETCWSRCWMLPGTQRERKEIILRNAHTDILWMHMYGQQQNRMCKDSSTLTQAVVPCIVSIQPALHCKLFILNWTRQTFRSCVVPGFMSRQCTTVSVSHDDGLNHSSGNTHVMCGSHLGNSSRGSQIQQCSSARCTFVLTAQNYRINPD